MNYTNISSGSLAAFNFGSQPEQSAFLSDVIEGLSRPQKSLSAKYFYDGRGCELFEAICRTPEYYPTRTELALLEKHADDIAALAGSDVHLIELGSGVNAKSDILLNALHAPASYIPVDIAADNLRGEAAALARRYPQLAVTPVYADFTQDFDLPPTAARGRRVGFFPGSTIGNFTPEEATEFLHRCAAMLGPDGLLIVGVDLKKSRRLLDDAYNDASGVTAAFNLNLLQRINRELQGTFDLDAFTHCAHYNLVRGRVEMHLYSLSFQSVRVAGRLFSFIPGESIHTENSYKYTVQEFQTMAATAGFAAEKVWTDENHLFAVHALRVAPPLN